MRNTCEMAYDEELANRLRETLQGEPGLRENRMFGGLAFLINGHLAVSASSRGGLLLRVDPAHSEALISEPDVERFEMRGRELSGWLHVGLNAIDTDEALEQWTAHGIRYARSLPPK
jgi:hypothetical protein